MEDGYERQGFEVQGSGLQKFFHGMVETTIVNPRSEVVTEKEVADISNDVGTCWRQLGLRHKITESTIHSTAEENIGNWHKAHALLIMWKQEKGKNATISHLAHVLEKIGRRSIAEKLLKSEEKRSNAIFVNRGWRNLADEFIVSKGDWDNLMSLERPSPSQDLMEKLLQFHHCFSFEALIKETKEMSCMNFIRDFLTKIRRQSIFSCLADFQGIANHSKLISGVYRNDQAHGKVIFQMEDCAFNGKGNRWLKEVKFRIQKSHLAPRNNPKNPWMDLHELYPNAEVEMKRNTVKVTIDSPQENHEFAVFGIPDVNDRKRMQVGLFGEKPLQGEDWKIWVILFDDTMMAFQHVCKMEEARGRELLTTLAGLFVFNSGEDIKINVRDVELGWKIKDGNEKVIKSNDAWNSPENSTDFPCCHFEVSHVDQGKKTFTCGVTVSHKQDSAEVEVTAVFEEPKKDREELHLPFAGDIAVDDFSDVLVFLQMFAMAMWFINSAVQPAGVLLDPN